MKKTLLLTLVAISVSTSLLAQGTVKFANTATSLVMTDADGSGGAAAVAAPSTSFHVALYWGVLGSTEAQLVQIGPDGPGTYAGVGGLHPALPGRFSAGSATYLTGTATAPSGTATFQVRGWTGNFASFDAAYAAALAGDTSVIVNSSALFTWKTGGGGTPTDPAPADLTVNSTYSGLWLTGPIPEPSTIALAGLGAVSLLLFRRRK